MVHESDETLMQRYQEGHAAAFDLLFERHRQKLWGFVLKRLSNRENAEEVFQLSWIKFHENRFRYDPQYPMIPWLYLITRQSLIDWVRKQKKISSETFNEEAYNTAASEEVTQQNESDFLAQMTNEEKLLYREHFEEGKTFEEIARALSIAPATLRKRFSRMIQRLRAQGADS